MRIVVLDRYVYERECDGGREHGAVTMNPNFGADTKRVLDDGGQNM